MSRFGTFSAEGMRSARRGVEGPGVGVSPLNDETDVARDMEGVGVAEANSELARDIDVGRGRSGAGGASAQPNRDTSIAVSDGSLGCVCGGGGGVESVELDPLGVRDRSESSSDTDEVGRMRDESVEWSDWICVDV